MKQEIEVCDQCNKKIKEEHIGFPEGDLDNHGIWMGDVHQWFWFTGEKFCSWKCATRYLDNKRKEMLLLFEKNKDE